MSTQQFFDSNRKFPGVAGIQEREGPGTSWLVIFLEAGNLHMLEVWGFLWLVLIPGPEECLGVCPAWVATHGAFKAPVWCSSCRSRCSPGLRFPVRKWTRPPLLRPPSFSVETLQKRQDREETGDTVMVIFSFRKQKTALRFNDQSTISRPTDVSCDNSVRPQTTRKWQTQRFIYNLKVNYLTWRRKKLMTTGGHGCSCIQYISTSEPVAWTAPELRTMSRFYCGLFIYSKKCQEPGPVQDLVPRTEHNTRTNSTFHHWKVLDLLSKTVLFRVFSSFRERREDVGGACRSVVCEPWTLLHQDVQVVEEPCGSTYVPALF